MMHESATAVADDAPARRRPDAPAPLAFRELRWPFHGGDYDPDEECGSVTMGASFDEYDATTTSNNSESSSHDGDDDDNGGSSPPVVSVFRNNASSTTNTHDLVDVPIAEGSSLPTVDGIHALHALYHGGGTSPYHHNKRRGRRLSRRWWMLRLVLLALVWAVLLLVLAGSVRLMTRSQQQKDHMNNNSNSSDQNQWGPVIPKDLNEDDNQKQWGPVIPKDLHNNNDTSTTTTTTTPQDDQVDRASIHDIKQFIMRLGVTSQHDLINTQSPQHLAAHWLAHHDPAALATLPGLDELHADQPNQERQHLSAAAYNYLTRYVMAVNYYAMTGNGQETWRDELGFLSEQDVCDWNDRDSSSSPVAWDKGYDTPNTDGTTTAGTSAPPDALGLVCHDTQRVPVALHLPDNLLAGFIPTENGFLTTLTSLDLSNNALTGSLPTDLCRLTHLQHLHLSDNQLTGKLLPRCLGTQLSVLETVDVSYNQLTGLLPSHIAHLTTLQQLVLDDNDLQGELDGLLPTSLQVVSARNNLFRGALDSIITPYHVFLQHLDLAHNHHITVTDTTDHAMMTMTNTDGTIRTIPLARIPLPGYLFELPNLLVLDLSHNQLHGELPDVPTAATANTALEYVALHHNELHGSIPAGWLSSLASLKHLDLASNDLTGTVLDLDQLHHLPRSLQTLVLNNNPALTPGLLALMAPQWPRHLHTLGLRNTARQGPIWPQEDDLPWISNLQYLDLRDNVGLTGTLPANAAYPYLTHLFLSRTSITGGFVPPPNHEEEDELLPNDGGGSSSNTPVHNSVLQVVTVDGTGLQGTLEWLCQLDQDNKDVYGIQPVFVMATCGPDHISQCSCCRCCNAANDDDYGYGYDDGDNQTDSTGTLSAFVAAAAEAKKGACSADQLERLDQQWESEFRILDPGMEGNSDHSNGNEWNGM